MLVYFDRYRLPYALDIHTYIHVIVSQIFRFLSRSIQWIHIEVNLFPAQTEAT